MNELTNYRMLTSDGTLVIPESMAQFYNWRDSEAVVVRRSTVNNLVVSTVCLGLHHLGGWFETMLFDLDTKEWLDFQWRYYTLEEAQQTHERIVQYIKLNDSIEGLEQII